MYRVVPRTKRGTTKEDEFISTVLYTYISGDDMESLLYHFMDEWLFVFSADPLYTYISGDDMESLLYHFMDEWLFVFSADPFFIARVR